MGGEIFRTCPDRPWGPPSLLYSEYRVFSGVTSGRGMTLTPHPFLVPPMGRTACTEPQCLYKGALNLFTFLSGRIHSTILFMPHPLGVTQNPLRCLSFYTLWIGGDFTGTCFTADDTREKKKRTERFQESKIRPES